MPELDFAQLSKQLEPRVLERQRDPRLLDLVQGIIDSGGAMPAVAVGIFLDEAPAGSSPATCVCCGDLAVLGPETQRVLASRPALVLCIVCTLALMSYSGFEPVVRRAEDVMKCGCGEDLHYTDPEQQAKVEDLVWMLGEYVTVTVAGVGSFEVPRHYIALHGIHAGEVPELVKRYGWPQV